MSAETLRKAAALMRERAEAAEQQPWRAYDVSEFISTSPTWEVGFTARDDEPLVGGQGVALANYIEKADAEHIASWHPAVALAVAHWLAECARLWEYGDVGPLMWQQANRVARAYLGEEVAS